MNFHGLILNNKITFNSIEFVKEKVKEYEGRQVILSIVEPKRSLNQNAYYWGAYLPLIAQETGNTDIEALHELFKKKFLPKRFVTVMGEEVEVQKSTKKLRKAEFAEFIMAIEAETQIPAPDPELAGYISNNKNYAN